MELAWSVVSMHLQLHDTARAKACFSSNLTAKIEPKSSTPRHLTFDIDPLQLRRIGLNLYRQGSSIGGKHFIQHGSDFPVRSTACPFYFQFEHPAFAFLTRGLGLHIKFCRSKRTVMAQNH